MRSALASFRPGQWRLFTPDYKSVSGPHWVVMTLFYVIAVGISMASSFRYHEFLARPALGVTLAGLLLLGRKDGMKFLAASSILSFILYPTVGASSTQGLIYTFLSMSEACLAAILVRRYCGGRIDLSRPKRLANFFVMAILPATIYRALGETFSTVGFLSGISDNLATLLGSHLVSMGLLTPLILLCYQKRDPEIAIRNNPKEAISLFSLLAAVTFLVFYQEALPLLFLPLLPLAWIAFRLDQRLSLLASVLLVMCASIASAEGWGPLNLLPSGDAVYHGHLHYSMIGKLSAMHVYAASIMALVLAIGSVKAEEKHVQSRAYRRHQDTLIALTEVKKAKDEIRHLAEYDIDTDLPNRTKMIATVSEYLNKGEHVFVAAFAIDRYAELRGSFGNALASEIVKRTAARISGFQDVKSVARLSQAMLGAVFHAPNQKAALLTLDEITRSFEKHISLQETGIDVRLTAGLGTGHDAKTLVHRAQTAVDQARKTEKAIMLFNASMESESISMLTLLSDLHKGLDNGDVWMSYQPKLDLKTGHIDSAECLIRWNHPVHGTIGPDHFIPIAEETGFIDPLTRWVVSQAVEGHLALAKQDLPAHIAINISARSIAGIGFAQDITSLVTGAGANPKNFTLEVTETGIMKRSADAVRTLHALKSSGFEISIDDYGAGQSSLRYLRRLPAGELKIDNAFVTNLAGDAKDAMLVRSTIDLAHGLGLKVVAEGVEDEAALKMLKLFGCDVAQGFHIARPMRLDKLIEFLSVSNRQMLAG